MINDANTSWVYQIGDNIFGNVLLVDADELISICSVISNSVVTTTYENIFLSKEILNTKYDCIVSKAIKSSNLNEDIYLKLKSLLKNTGILAVIKDNASSFRNLTDLKYLLFLIKNIVILVKRKINAKKYNNDIIYYMEVMHERVSEVFCKSGYKSVKNSFLLKEKLFSLFLSKYTYPIFSSTEMTLSGNFLNQHKTTIENIANIISTDIDVNFTDLIRYRVIPYKALVSMSDEFNNDYIFLLLSGDTKNIRANHELNMLNFLHDQYPMLTDYLAKPITFGVYKKLEYIVYQEIHGVFIDTNFKMFNVAKSNAFEMLKQLAIISEREVKINQKLYDKLCSNWFIRIKSCNHTSEFFKKYIDNLKLKIFNILDGSNCSLVLYHGDYKIENLIFNENDYTITGIIDWDLAEHLNFPGLDLLYFIIYNRRIVNSSEFTEEAKNIFIGDGFLDHENELLDDYYSKYSISEPMFKCFCALFIIHHFSFRERSSFNEGWLMSLLTEFLSSDDFL